MPKGKDQVTMKQKIAETDKKIKVEAKQANGSDSPAMEKPFDKVPKPIKTVKRIVESPDGKGYQLLPEKEKKKIDTEKKVEQLGLVPFSDDEDDEFSLEAVTSCNSKGSNKSQGSQKLSTKPEGAQSNNLMPRTATKVVKEGEMSHFHKDAFEAAGGVKTPDAKGSVVDGWAIAGT